MDILEKINRILNEGKLKIGDEVQGLFKDGKPNPEYKGILSRIQKDGNYVIKLNKPLKSTGQSEVVLEPNMVK